MNHRIPTRPHTFGNAAATVLATFGAVVGMLVFLGVTFAAVVAVGVAL